MDIRKGPIYSSLSSSAPPQSCHPGSNSDRKLNELRKKNKNKKKTEKEKEKVKKRYRP